MDFDALALKVFAYQFEHVEVYRKFCERRGVLPGQAASWRHIPALPVDAFKRNMGLPGKRAIRFASSGTTQGASRRSTHQLRNTQTYRASALAHFTDMVVPDDPGAMTCLVLGPTLATHPESSLGQMFTWCAQEYTVRTDSRAPTPAGNTTVCFAADGSADLDAAVKWLTQAASAAKPVLILAISSALSGLFAELRKRRLMLRLPADSRIVDTGGSKGAAGVLSARGMLKAAWRYLHVAAYSCVNQYGMTEMLSQFYDDALISRVEGSLAPRSKRGPVWVRTSVVHPATLAPVSAGETGILRHVDLANWDTVSALQTLDTGHTLGRGFALTGRAPLAEARGCSQLMAVLDQGGLAKAASDTDREPSQ